MKNALARIIVPALFLGLVFSPLLHAKRGLRTLAWRRPAPPWTAAEFTLSAAENDTQVRITFLPPGGRSAFFLAKTGIAGDPFANDVSTLTFQIEIENRSRRTLALEPKQFKLVGQQASDSPWGETEYVTKFNALGATELDRMRKVYLTQRVELLPGSKVNRLLVFDSFVMDSRHGFMLTAENLPIGQHAGKATAAFVMQVIILKAVKGK